MDKAIFQFDANAYNEEDVKGFSRDLCEHLANVDEDNVTKFDLDPYDKHTARGVENLLNDDMLDTTNCFFRVFFA